MYICRYDQSVEIILKDWILQRMATERKRVTHKELRQKALELILPYNLNFLASKWWIRSFLLRNDINLKAMAHKIQYSNSKTVEKRNDNIASTHHCTIKSEKDYFRIEDSEASSKEYTYPLLGLRRHQDNIFSLTHTFTQNLPKIGRPRELLKQDINWKVVLF